LVTPRKQQHRTQIGRDEEGKSVLWGRKLPLGKLHNPVCLKKGGRHQSYLVLSYMAKGEERGGIEGRRWTLVSLSSNSNDLARLTGGRAKLLKFKRGGSRKEGRERPQGISGQGLMKRGGSGERRVIQGTRGERTLNLNS